MSLKKLKLTPKDTVSSQNTLLNYNYLYGESILKVLIIIYIYKEFKVIISKKKL